MACGVSMPVSPVPSTKLSRESRVSSKKTIVGQKTPPRLQSEIAGVETGHSRMKLKEIAEHTGAAYRTVADYARKAGWTKNGKQTLLDERQATLIIEAMKQGANNQHDLASSLQGVETGQSRALRMWNLHNQMRDLYEAEIADLKSQNVALARDLSANRRLLAEREIGLEVIQRIAEAGGLMLSDREDALSTYGRRK